METLWSCCVDSAVDLIPGQGEFAKGCVEMRTPELCFGLAEKHNTCVEERLTQWGRDPHGDRGKQSAAQKCRGHPCESEEAGADNGFQGKCGGLPGSKAQGLATSCMEPFNLRICV